MSSWKQKLVGYIFFVLVSVLLIPHLNNVHAVACAGDCSVYGCDLGLSCKPTDNICGAQFDTCTGANANSKLCSNNNLWDITAPCNGVSLGETCTSPGVTRTATWGAPLGVCNATCGSNGTQTQTCNCSANNGCAVSCLSPAGACTTTGAPVSCCASVAPLAPTITSAGNGSCTTGAVTINWDFGNTGCGSGWGFACSNPSNSFSIYNGAALIASGISSETRSYTTTLSAGTHSLTVRANNGLLSTSSPSYSTTINIDTSPPAVPVGTVTFTPDPTCKDTYTATYSWGDVADVGCADLNATPYWAQGSSASDFSSVLYGWNNTWAAASPTNQTTATAYAPGTTLYFHVRSRDALDNQSAWSSTSTVTVPSPTPYPTIHVEGPLNEDINRACYPMSLLRDLTLEPVIVPALGVTPICTMPTTDSYSCNFIIDNQKANCVSPSITVTMNATYSGYGTIGWRSGLGGGECTGTPVSRTYSPGTSETNIPIFLTYNTVLPTTAPTSTPIPTVTPGGPTLTPVPTDIPIPTPPFAPGWFKLKDTSFHSRQSNRQNFIPGTIRTYDATEDDSVVNHHILIGSSGLLLQNGPIDPGSNAYVNGEITYSQQNLYTNGYTSTNTITYSKYIEYVRARKGFTPLEGALNAASFPTSGTYLYTGDVTLDPTWFDNKQIVFVVQGTATIASPTFTPTNGTLALLSSMIAIDPTVTEINAILIGSQVSMGNSDINPLKIKGNLIDEETSGIVMGRARSDGTKPSLFVVFDPQMYLAILPYLSTSTYDWRQTQ